MYGLKTFNFPDLNNLKVYHKSPSNSVRDYQEDE